MQYDIFLSYSRDDVGWASKLQGKLVESGLRVFRDVDRLGAGEHWEPALTHALGESQHLVALWSASARNSDWVTRELGHFDALSTKDPKRKIIVISLDATQNRAYSSLQSIMELTAVNTSVTPPDQVDANVWAKIVHRIADTVQAQEDSIPISVAILTVTDDAADSANFNGLTQAHLDAVNQSFGLDQTAVKARYRPSRLDWHPYGGELTIRSILDNLVSDLNKAVKNNRFRWHPIPDSLWDDMTTERPQEVAAQMATEPLALVIIDTLVLGYQPVFLRAALLREYLRSSSCAWLLMPPRPSDTQLLAYQTVLKGWGTPLLNDYFEPPMPRRETTPLFGIYCGDDREIRRLLRTAAGEYLSQQLLTTGNVFTRMARHG